MKTNNFTSETNKTTIFQSEAQLQAACVLWFKNEFREIRDRLYRVPNDAKRNIVIGAQEVAMGLTKGVLDLNLDIANGQYNGLRIEMKKPGEKATPEQKRMILQNMEFGYKSVVIDNLEAFQLEVLSYLPAHLIPESLKQLV